MIVKVRKRDNRIKDYLQDRIVSAIRKCYVEVLGEEEGNICLEDNINFLIPYIEKRIEDLNEPIVDVEVVQDFVIEALDKFCIQAIAKSYKDYREQRTLEREKNSKKEQFYKDVLNCSNIDNDNANVNQSSFSGRKARISDYEQKMFALRNLISPEGKKAFEDGLIYYHDLSSYAIGEHNCLNANLDELLSKGFSTRNGDVRPASTYSTACQLTAVIFQCQSQVQYGGVGAMHLDYTLAPYVKKSFIKHFKDGFFEKYNIECTVNDECVFINNEELKINFKEAYDYAMRHLNKEGKQATEGLYHNLNTLESRAGSQVPFTSINLGRDTSPEGRLINQWIFNASLNGIGKLNKTSIFPISIFQYKKGVNDKEGTPNYDLKKLAIESLSKRIYPNIVNCDWLQNQEDPNNIDTMMATMG